MNKESILAVNKGKCVDCGGYTSLDELISTGEKGSYRCKPCYTEYNDLTILKEYTEKKPSRVRRLVRCLTG